MTCHFFLCFLHSFTGNTLHGEYVFIGYAKISLYILHAATTKAIAQPHIYYYDDTKCLPRRIISSGTPFCMCRFSGLHCRQLGREIVRAHSYVWSIQHAVVHAHTLTHTYIHTYIIMEKAYFRAYPHSAMARNLSTRHVFRTRSTKRIYS